ncbi:hypothetical protein BDZ45DRAFT_740265 [Acephala macrosclerotiorum]|nr:hypothetical protein BDZ45DRAFT_740265 [Acephala macrosclerotiorum]
MTSLLLPSNTAYTSTRKLSSSLRSSVSVYVSAIIPTVFNTVQIALTQLASTVTVSNQYTVTAIASTLTVTAIASTITITETAAAPSVQALTVTSYAAVTADALSGTPIMIYATVTAVAPSVPPVVVTSYTTLTAAAPTVASATFTCTSGVNC